MNSSGQSEGEIAPTQQKLSFRGILREASSWGSLKDTPYGLTPALILVAIGFFQAFDSASFAYAVPEIIRDLKIDIVKLANISAVIGSISTFGVIGIGWLADRTRRVPMVGIGTMLSGVFSMASSRSQSLLSLGTFRTIDDVSDTISSVPVFSLLADYYPPDSRGKVFAMIGTLSRIPIFIVPAATGALIVIFGWRPTAFALGAPLLVVGLLALILLKEPVRGYFERQAFGASDALSRKEDEPQSFGEGWRTTWSVRTIRRVFIADIFAASGSVFAIFMAAFFQERYGLNAFQRSLLFYPSAIAGLAGGFLGGGLIDYLIGRNPGRVLTLLGIFGVIGAVGQVGIAFGPPLALLILANMILGFGSSLVGPAGAVVTSQVIPPSIRTQGLQLFGLSGLPARVIFTPIVGQIFARYGYRTTFLSGVPLMILGAIIRASAGRFFEVDRRNAFAAAMAADEWRKTVESGKSKLLVCRGIDVEYDGVQVLFDVDFDVQEGEIVALLGTNGAGKSTLLRAISGIQEAAAGGIVFDGRDITHMPPHEIAGRGVVHMPGGRGVFPTLSVRENLLLGRWLLEDPAEARERLAEVYEIFPMLRQRGDEPASALSGGEQQMLSLAQAFLTKPRILMIDELSLGLSPAVVAKLLEMVKEINRRGTSIIVVEQSVSVALNIAERAVFMEKGEIKFMGKTSELLQRPDILRAVYVKGTGGLAADGQTTIAESKRLGLPVLEVVGLTKSFGGVQAVDGVSFELRDGEVLGLIGPNGAGKTTIFDLISGYQTPDAGTVKYEGVDVTGLPAEELARRKMIRRFQNARLFPSLLVEEALLIALEQRLESKSTLMILSQLPGPRRAERRVRAQADRLIEMLGLEAFRGKFVRELSTGVRRILDLGCVLAAQPKVLMLDEPSTGIAQAEALGLGPLLLRVRSETGCSILIIEHTMSLISEVSDELIALEQGRILMRGTPEVVLNDDRVIQSYLGGAEASLRR